MHGIEVNVISKSVRKVPFTAEQEAAVKEMEAAWEAAQAATKQDTDTESMIQSKMRELAVNALVSEGKLPGNGKLAKETKE
jgi:hypothetical protein